MGSSPSSGASNFISNVGSSVSSAASTAVQGTVQAVQTVETVLPVTKTCCYTNDCYSRTKQTCKLCLGGAPDTPGIPSSCNMCNSYEVNTTCAESYCPDGQVNVLGICWDEMITTCDGGITTRDAPRSCEAPGPENGYRGYNFDPSDITKSVCYQDCENGFHNRAGDIVQCWNNNSNPMPITDSEPYSCGSNRDLIDGLCYNSCPQGSVHVPGAPYQCMGINGLDYTINVQMPYTSPIRSTLPFCGDAENINGLCYASCQENERVPGMPSQCMGHKGLSYFVQTSVPKINAKNSYEANCKSNRDKDESLCYKKCSDVFQDNCLEAMPGFPTQCQESKGVMYIPPIADKPCPDGYVFDGVDSCKNSYVAQVYGKGLIAASCPDGNEQIGPLCYRQCPRIDQNGNLTSENNSKTIQLGHIDGVGLAGFCGPPRFGAHPPFYSAGGAPFYFPKITRKIRKVAYSTKSDTGTVVS